MKVYRHLNHSLAASIAAVLAMAAPSANAQEDQETAAVPAKSVVLSEILVTARKREETLLEVPLPITVLTSEAIELKAIEELDDIVDYSPGFYYGGPTGGNSSRSTRRLLMRGMQVNTDNQDLQATRVFIDGAPVLGSEFGSLSGIERVEVIKGPQSAYFGRSTFAGAINFITRNPSMDGWEGTARVESGSYGKRYYGLDVEGPIITDKLGIRLSASDNSTDGQYVNATGGQKLGMQSTKDIQATIFFTPTEKFDAKVRLHEWVDEDGPGSGFAYGLRNGDTSVFNCNLAPGAPGTASNISGGNLLAPSGTYNWICGTPRFPHSSEIQMDAEVTPDIQLRLDNKAPDQTHFMGPKLRGFGLYRELYEYSLVASYGFDNGIQVSALAAAHGKVSRGLDDGDRRHTADLGVRFNTVGVNDAKQSDESYEIRITSAADQRLRWLLGYSFSDALSQGGAGQSRGNTGVWTNPPNGKTFTQTETAGIFGSVSFDFNEKWELNVEARSQEDTISQGSETGILCPIASPQNCGNVEPGDTSMEATFDSFTPRYTLDYKPTDEVTLYGIFAQGTRPGTFNTALLTVPPSVLSCIQAAVGADILIPEENLDNYELGFKGLLWGGRATLTVAVYYAQWRNQQNRGLAPCEWPDGVIRTTATTGAGGSSDLQGVEVEFNMAATDKLNLELTFALNESLIIKRDCADCLVILGDRNLTRADDKMYSRYPKVSGSFSAMYADQLTDSVDWFLRGDYLYKGNQWAMDTNVTGTGDSHRLNLRAGVEINDLRLEVYVTNQFDDKTFNGYQRLTDFAFTRAGFSPSILTASLPEKRTYGVRVTYDFDWN